MKRNIGIIIVDDPFVETNTPENKTKFDFWLEKTFSARLKTYKGPTIILKTNKMERTITPKKKSLRRELECYVVAWNTVLKDAVKSMSLVMLLRNAHPAYRTSYAGALKEAGMLTEAEAKEFQVFSTTRG